MEGICRRQVDVGQRLARTRTVINHVVDIGKGEIQIRDKDEAVGVDSGK